MDNAALKRILEAALLASQHPLNIEQLTQLFGDDDVPSHDALAQALHELQGENANRGIELVEVASGFRYQVQHDVYPWISRLWTERQSKYSRALLETLALIAYRQPITRGEIEQIRGVVVSTSTIRTLEEREWVRVVGHRDMPGRPALFGTTKQFLDYFNLKSLDQLPPLSEIRDLAELEPQLEFDGPKPISLPLDDLAEVVDESGETNAADVDAVDESQDGSIIATRDDANESLEPNKLDHEVESIDATEANEPNTEMNTPNGETA